MHNRRQLFEFDFSSALLCISFPLFLSFIFELVLFQQYLTVIGNLKQKFLTMLRKTKVLSGLVGVTWIYWWVSIQDSTKCSLMYIYSSSERQIASIWAKNGHSYKGLREAENFQENAMNIFVQSCHFQGKKRLLRKVRDEKNEIKLFTCFLLLMDKKGIS